MPYSSFNYDNLPVVAAGAEDQFLVWEMKEELGNNATDKEVLSTLDFLEELEIFDGYKDDYEDFF